MRHGRTLPAASISPVSVASTRARVRLPSAAAAARAASAGSIALGDQHVADGGLGDRAANSMRTQREAIGDQLGRHLVGEHDEHGAGRRLLDGLQQAGGAVRVEEVELVEHHHLAAALDGCQRCVADDVGDLLLRDAGAGALDLADVGVLAGERQPGIALRRIVVAAISSSAAKARAASSLVRPGWADEQVGVHRMRSPRG